MFSLQDHSTLTRLLAAARVAITFEGGMAWLPGRRTGLRSAEGARGAVFVLVGAGGVRLSMPMSTIAEAARALIAASAAPAIRRAA